MNDIERLHEVVCAIGSGWNERIEYKVMRSGVPEIRIDTRWQPAILQQLGACSSTFASRGTQPEGSRPKPSSRPPGSLEAMHLLGDIHETAVEWLISVGWASTDPPHTMGTRAALGTIFAHVRDGHVDDEAIREITRSLHSLRRQALILLGYEKPMKRLAGTSCGQCGGTLVVAEDGQSDVRCVRDGSDPHCRSVYPRASWVELLQDIEESA